MKKGSRIYLIIALLISIMAATGHAYFGKTDSDYYRHGELPGALVQNLSAGTNRISIFNGIGTMPDGSFGLAGMTSISTPTGPDALCFAKLDYLGRPDTSFGSNGFFAVEYPTRILSVDMTAGKTFVQNDGKILMVHYWVTTNGSVQGFVARAKADGSGMDPDFRNNLKYAGIYDDDIGTNFPTAFTDGVFLDDGRFIAVGVLNPNHTRNCAYLVCLATNGTRDATFGASGRALNVVESTDTVAYACTYLPGGNLYLGAKYTMDSTGHVAVLCYSTNGTINSSFGTNGIIKQPVGDDDHPFAIATYNSAVFVGCYTESGTNQQLAVFKIDPQTGQIDTSFGIDGIARTAVLPDLNSEYAAMTIQNDGKILLNSTCDLNSLDNVSFLYRFNADGSIDYSFGPDKTGMVYLYTNSRSLFLGLKVCNGKAYCAGTLLRSAYNLDAMVARMDVQTIYKADFDGDSLSDIGCYYAPEGYWYVYMTSRGFGTTQFGFDGTLPFSGDFDNDGYTDVGYYYPDTGLWYIYKSHSGPWTNQFGFAGTTPVTGDFDADGTTDFGCYYPDTGWWYLYKSGSGFWTTQFGYAGTLPITGDFDGDGLCDFGCYYPDGGWWYIYKSMSGLWVTQFGYADTLPITGDFDGDGIDDFGCYKDDIGSWYVYKSSGGFWTTNFGYDGTLPVTGDYDGDGITDFGCYYPDGGWWYLYKSTTGLWTTQFGYTGTVPVD